MMNTCLVTTETSYPVPLTTTYFRRVYMCIIARYEYGRKCVVLNTYQPVGKFRAVHVSTGLAPPPPGRRGYHQIDFNL
jgi:hypothetical protein